MKIKEVTIINFRGIKRFDIDNLSNLNVIAGINGAGKTSILLAIRIMLSWLVARIKNIKGRGITIQDSDITKGEDFCFIKIILDSGISWQLYKKRSGIRRTIEADAVYKTSMSEMMSVANSIADAISQNPDGTDIPLIDAYGVNRMVEDTPMRVRKAHKLSVLDALSATMSNSVNFHDFFIWFREIEDIENESMRNNGVLVRDRKLDAVRSALANLMDGYSGLKVQRNPRAFIISKDGVPFNFNQLSDGEKSYIALVLDIARKMAMTHPTLANPLEGEGVVLIDEIDLHLHPSWQRDAIQRFQKIFPKCQFLITTHSPHVVSCVNLNDGDKLITLRNGNVCEVNNNQYGLEAERVLAEIFQMDSMRNRDVQERIDAVWGCLRQNDYQSDTFTTNLNWLKANVDASDSIFAQINLQIALIKKGLA